MNFTTSDYKITSSITLESFAGVAFQFAKRVFLFSLYQ